MPKNNRSKSLLLLSLFLSVPLIAQPTGNLSGAVTLRQCYDWALAQNEDLKILTENIEQSKSRAKSAIGSALPDVRWNLDVTWQEPSGVEALKRKGFSGFAEKQQTESRFTAKQALFSGLQEFSAFAGFKHESESDRLYRDHAQRALFEQVALAFYRVVLSETDHKNYTATYALTQDRVKELTQFRKLGKSRESDVYSAKAVSAAIKGRLDQIEGDIFSAREELSFLTGQDLSTVPIAEELSVPTAAPPLDQELARVHERTDLRAQRELLAAQKLRIRYEKGGYWPYADLTGNYYTRRATFLKDIDWDVILNVGVPLYQGGKVSAAVEAALSAYKKSSLQLQQMERNAASTVKRLRGELAAAIKEAQSMDEAAKAARGTYDDLSKEYRLGLVTNLDVFEALDLYRNQQTNSDTAKIKAKVLLIQLNVATEALP